ncbi:MAG: peptidylprolyl isomerase [Planctomycetaceae bacterium]|jgi:peptidyl-prolyl cis-trans isomerase B (cyclophilin B)|nr:peptidylprolyl isomerase [Planctomycetaceae bacterium]
MLAAPATLLVATSALAAADLSPKSPIAKPEGAIVAVLAGVEAPCELVLLDRDAVELGRATAAAGDVDLAALFPAIRGATRALRVQAVVGGVPEGAPLVVVPLLSRPTIRTARDLRPDGKTEYTRVVGWGSELLDPSNEAHAKLKEAWPKPDPTPLSGFRLARDRDVVFETTVGRMRFAMRHDEAPNTARNFIELAEAGLYDGTVVHRIVPADRNGKPFVIQGGDPTGTGDGGPGYDIALEPSRLAHEFGVISMARNDWPDSAGSQWFVCLSREATARLDGQYCAFGHAVEGAEAILRIADGELADIATGRPVKPETVVRAYTVPALPWTPGKGRPDARVERPDAPRAPEVDR